MQWVAALTLATTVVINVGAAQTTAKLIKSETVAKAILAAATQRVVVLTLVTGVAKVETT